MVFGPDERAQSTLVGFILLFGILVIAFSSYQAVVVPNQNAEVEFNHFQDVQDDFSEFRSAVINSVGEDDDRSVSFKLGAEYPARLIALNPPPISGQLETTPARPVTIESGGDDRTADVCGTDDATSRSLVYTPNYNEFRSPEATSYENTFVSREFTDGNVYDTQRLVQERDGSPDRIDLLLLNGSVSRSSQDSYSVEINSSGRGSAEIEDPVVTIPSRFDADTWENEILIDVDNINAITQPEPGLIEIEFDPGTYRLSCAVAGLDSAPEFEPPDTGGDGDGTGDINPDAPGDIRLNGVRTLNQGQDEVEVAFQNLAESDTAITDARINFYQTTGGQTPRNAVISADQGGDSGTLVIGRNFDPVDPEITLASDAESTVWFNFDRGVNPNDWFVLTLQFDNGEPGQYFISLRDSNGGDLNEGDNNGVQEGNSLIVDDGNNEEPPTAVDVEDDGDFAAARFSLVNTDEAEKVTEIISLSFEADVDRIEQQNNAEEPYNRAVTVVGENSNAEITDESINPSVRYTFDGVADIEADDGTATVYMNKFQEEPGNSGNIKPVDMDGETITITVEYRQGGEQFEQTFDMTLSQTENIG